MEPFARRGGDSTAPHFAVFIALQLFTNAKASRGKHMFFTQWTVVRYNEQTNKKKNKKVLT